MKFSSKLAVLPALCVGTLFLVVGCRLAKEVYVPPVPPLGTQLDGIWQTQETNGEAADWVIYQHEWDEIDGWRLNHAGEDHLKQIALRMLQGETDFPLLVEQSNTLAKEDTTYRYPIHPNPELDMERRAVIVRLLSAFGVTDAEDRVIVSPIWTF